MMTSGILKSLAVSKVRKELDYLTMIPLTCPI